MTRGRAPGRTPDATQHASHAALPPTHLELALQQAAPPRRGPFDESFGARVGGMLVGSFRTSASLDVTGTSIGTEVDFENDLGLKGQGGVFRADGWLRFSRHDRLDVTWFTLDRSATRNTSRDIQWGDEVFPINTQLTGELSTDILQLRYTRYFLAGDDYELGAGLGIYGMNLTAGLRASVLGIEETFKTPVPLPVLSVQGAWEIAPRLQLVGAAQFLYVELQNIGTTDKITGSVLDLLLGLEYEVVDRVGIGTCYNYFQIDAGAVRDALDLDVEYGYSALFLYMTVKV